VEAVKTRQSAKSKTAVNTWTCYFKNKSPSKFEKVEENNIEVVASTQVDPLGGSRGVISKVFLGFRNFGYDF
jgi:hypothetical protein